MLGLGKVTWEVLCVISRGDELVTLGACMGVLGVLGASGPRRVECVRACGVHGRVCVLEHRRCECVLIVGEPRGAIGQVLLMLTARSARVGTGQSMQDVGKIAGEWRRGCAQFTGSGYKAAWWRCNRWTLSSSCSRKGRTTGNR